jgi:hypothetical protein
MSSTFKNTKVHIRVLVSTVVQISQNVLLELSDVNWLLRAIRYSYLLWNVNRNTFRLALSIRRNFSFFSPLSAEKLSFFFHSFKSHDGMLERASMRLFGDIPDLLNFNFDLGLFSEKMNLFDILFYDFTKIHQRGRFLIL